MFDEIMEGVGRKETMNEWYGNWNIASPFNFNAQQWKGPIVYRRRQEVLEAPEQYEWPQYEWPQSNCSGWERSS